MTTNQITTQKERTMTTIQTLATQLGFDSPYGLRAFADDLLDDLASDHDEVPADVEQILRDAVGAGTAPTFEGVAHFPEGVAHFPEVAAHFVIDFTDGEFDGDMIPFDDSDEEPTEAQIDDALAAWDRGARGMPRIAWTRTSPLRRDAVTGRLVFDVHGRAMAAEVETPEQRVDRLHGEAFAGPRERRSPAYQAGVRVGLEAAILGRLKMARPYQPGSAELDAWYAGVEDGRAIGRRKTR